MFVVPMGDLLVVGMITVVGAWVCSLAAWRWLHPESQPTRWWAALLLAAIALGGYYIGARWHLSATHGITNAQRIAMAGLIGMAIALALGKVLGWAILNLRAVRVQPAIEEAPRS
jgi:hypothetical protein